MTEQWKIFEAELEGTQAGNPYREVFLEADFQNGGTVVPVKGFYCGEGKYKIRFMPSQQGIWRAVTKSNDPQLDGVEILCECEAAKKGNHGRVLPRSEVRFQKKSETCREDFFRFSYEDGTAFHPFGTTCYAWIHQEEKVQEQTLETLKMSPFNKVRMCIFPKYYIYNEKEPKDYPFAVDEQGEFDLESFQPAFWDRLEKRIAQLDEMGIQADLILFHPYDKWGFSKMEQNADVFYLEYAVRRLSHYKNVWWSMANEYDLLTWKTKEDWELYADTVIANDPYGHLRSIHNCMKFYDYTKPWITHCSIQRTDIYKTAELVNKWRECYQKPVVVDECAYEGNINYGWGNITGEELTRRFWEGCIRGGYLSHGETYVDRGELIWWSHGGPLYGSSPTRIGFLRKVIEEAPEDAAPLKVTPENAAQNWDVPCLCKEDEYFLYYFGFSCPSFRTYELPEGAEYEIELLDTWNMTIQKLPGIYAGNIRLEMPGRQYMAFRMKKIKR